jgi:uncharacterized protein with HEPN domain
MTEVNKVDFPHVPISDISECRKELIMKWFGISESMYFDLLNWIEDQIVNMAVEELEDINYSLQSY